MVYVHPRPFLKPNWLSPVLRVYWNLSEKQYSKILLKMGVMAIPLKYFSVRCFFSFHRFMVLIHDCC